MWYTTEDARRDAAKQSANQRDDRPSPDCSSFCAAGEPCAITEDGKCVRRNGGLNRRDGSVADGTSALKPLLGEDGGE